MNRASWLRAAGAAGVSLALPFADGTPAEAYGALVFDPAAYAGILKTLANDFIHNKNELMLINLALHQWQDLMAQRRLNIGQAWSDLSPYIGDFNKALSQNDKISQATKDVYAAIQQTYPDFDPNAPIPYLIDVYRKYLQISAHNILAANQIAKQQIQTHASEIGAIAKRGNEAQTQHDQYQATLEMSAATARGVDMLHSTMTSLVGGFAHYVEERAAKDAASDGSGRILLANNLLLQANDTLTKDGAPAHSAVDYIRNPSLLPKPVIPH